MWNCGHVVILPPADKNLEQLEMLIEDNKQDSNTRLMQDDWLERRIEKMRDAQLQCKCSEGLCHTCDEMSSYGII